MHLDDSMVVGNNSIIRNSWINKFSLMACDVISLVCSFFICYYVLRFWSLDLDHPFAQLFNIEKYKKRMIVFFVLTLSLVFVFWQYHRHYTYRKPFWNELKEILQTMSVLAILDISIMALNKWDFSRFGWLLLWVISFFLLPFFRVVTKNLLLKLGVWQWPSIIIGAGANAVDTFYAVNSEKLLGYNVLAFVEPESKSSITKKNNLCGLPVINELPDSFFLDISNYQVFLSLEYEEHDTIDSWMQSFALHQINNVAIVPPMRGIPLYGMDISHFFSHEILLLKLKNNLERFTAQVVKRIFDIVVSSFFLVILSPLFIYISIKVSRDGGSPFYGHERVGKNRKLFKCYKFRSMIKNSKEVLDELLAANPEAKAEWENDFKLKNDPRITPIGHFLRKTSLDELPQLWNVLKGEMSLVGPRPVVEEELLRYGNNANYYLMAKPGVTGLWQVSGRNDIDYATRVYLDSWYIKNWSLWYDIAIMFKTINVVLKRDGAY